MPENTVQEELEKENNMHRGATTYEALRQTFSHILAHLTIDKSMALGSIILNLQRKEKG